MKLHTTFVKIITASLFLLTTAPAFAQLSVSAQQILMPKKVYIGDTAELRCSFNTDLDLFKKLPKGSSKELSVTSFTSELNSKEYDIKNIQFITNNTSYYTLVITFVPWKTGNIRFPAYDVVSGFCLATDSQNINHSSLILSFDDVNIVSLTEQNSIDSPRGALSPLLLPGTTYKIYGIIILLIVLAILTLEAILKHKKIATFIRTQKLLAKYRKNKKQTLKALNKLSAEEISDKETAEQLQKCMRNYLKVRFDYPFTNCGASEIMSGFYKATCGLAGEVKENAVGEIAAAFIRTDFIRYSHNSYGKTKASFNKDEKNKIIEGLKNNIESIEAPEPKKDSNPKQEVQNV
ncbi:MAG: hypothetical protein PUH13_08590 [Treponema sp.]|nr:hypothetical protein [Treponema sp.]